MNKESKLAYCQNGRGLFWDGIQTFSRRTMGIYKTLLIDLGNLWRGHKFYEPYIKQNLIFIFMSILIDLFAVQVNIATTYSIISYVIESYDDQ
jgi:hypothetical protein